MPDRIDPPTMDVVTTFIANQEGRYSQLNERVTNISSRINQLDERMGGMTAALNSLGNDFRNGQRPQWQALGVVLTFMTIVGALAYWPIRTQADQQSAAISKMQDILSDMPNQYSPRAETERVSKYAEELRQRMVDDIAELQHATIQRPEYEATIAAMQHDIDALEGKEGRP